jgi:hypothetical protein
MTQADSVHSTPPTNTPVDTTRRRVLAVAAVASAVSAGTLAAFTAAPAIALPPPADKANALWADRQVSVDSLLQLSLAYDTAHSQLPAWVMAGPERIDADGNACGEISSWPLIENVAPPPFGERIVRPAIWQAKEHFEFAVSVFGSTQKFRENSRAAMRRSIKAIVVRLRERKRLYEELNLNQLDRQMTAACNAICAAEGAIGELEQLPNVVAAQLLASLSNDCSRTSCATGNGYCGTMAMGLIALRGLSPLRRSAALLFPSISGSASRAYSGWVLK